MKTIRPVGWFVKEEVGTVIVDGIGVDKNTEVAPVAGSAVEAGFTDSGVDADNVANRSVVWVGADVPRLQATRIRRGPLQIINRLFI